MGWHRDEPDTTDAARTTKLHITVRKGSDGWYEVIDGDQVLYVEKRPSEALALARGIIDGIVTKP